MKKILYVIESSATGTLSILVDLCRELYGKYELVVAYGVRADTPDNIEELFQFQNDVFQECNVKMIRMQELKKSLSPVTIKRATQELKQIWQEELPDVVHFHSSMAGLIGRLLLFSPGVKKKLTRRKDRYFPVYYTPHGYAFLQENITSKKRLLYKVAERILAKMGGITIACSEWEYSCGKDFVPKQFFVNNGIDVATMSIERQQKTEEKTSMTVYIAGRITYARNPKLFNEIATHFPDVQFVWIGDGELRDDITAKNIQVTGFMDRTACINRAMDADVFLLPSLWEGLSVSLLEAMYMEKICVVSDIPQNRMVITSGVNGYLCHDLDDYVCVLNKIINNMLDSSSIREQAHKLVEDKYTTKMMAERYQAIYEEQAED